jgi:hypothetical protein
VAIAVEAMVAVVVVRWWCVCVGGGGGGLLNVVTLVKTYVNIERQHRNSHIEELRAHTLISLMRL